MLEDDEPRFAVLLDTEQAVRGAVGIPLSFVHSVLNTPPVVGVEVRKAGMGGYGIGGEMDSAIPSTLAEAGLVQTGGGGSDGVFFRRPPTARRAIKER